ncbi:bifunctional succinylornithine transaminase/acetylornithine transaminase [Vibrio sp.]|nr:bifunctional succinylornithine transaminase/acetylornithine transaminase [Vibrio sp.]
MDYTPVRDDFDKYMIPMFSPAPFIPVKGHGSVVIDQTGKDYIDFVGGIAVNSLGHANEELVSNLVAQLNKISHLGNGYTNEPVLKLAKTLCGFTFAEKVFFCNSGAEANEAALKLARKYALENYSAEKNEILAFNSAFHGRTLFTVSAGGQPKYSQDFGPLPGAIKHQDFNDIDAAINAITDKTCAVIVEPIQGEGGVIPANKEFLLALREACDRHAAILIFDEVQTGVGRTGQLYAYMHYGVVPDVLSTAKALGGGFPIGAILTTDKFASALSVGSHGTTYGGNPLAATAANTVLSIVSQIEFLDDVKNKHQLIKQGLSEMNARHGIFQDIRGMGLLIGCELKEHFKGKAKALSNICAENGVMVLIAGPNVVRFAPALNITQEEIEMGLMRFEQALEVFINKE